MYQQNVLILLIVLIAQASCRSTQVEHKIIAGSPEEHSLIAKRHVGEWTYGEDTWAINFEDCAGHQQSPVNLRSKEVTYDSNLKPFAFEGFDTTSGVEWDIMNNGHTVRVDYLQGRLLVSGGSLGNPYQVVQFHWHWGRDKSRGSEHLVDGKAFPMELHIVCYNTKYDDIGASLDKADGLAVLGFFYNISNTDNPFMQKIIDAFQFVQHARNESTVIEEVALKDIMASTKHYYRYQGSLTTPPCNEVVTWTVFADPIPISEKQLDKFRKLKSAHETELFDDYRPVQNLNSRSIKTNFFIAGSHNPEASSGHSRSSRATLNAAFSPAILAVLLFCWFIA